jgi:hypothetical protein
MQVGGDYFECKQNNILFSCIFIYFLDNIPEILLPDLAFKETIPECIPTSATLRRAVSTL